MFMRTIRDYKRLKANLYGKILVTAIACDYVNYMTLNYPHVHDFHLQH